MNSILDLLKRNRLVKEIKWGTDRLFQVVVSRLISRNVPSVQHHPIIVVLATDGIGDYTVRVRFVRLLETIYPNHSIYHIVRKETRGLEALFPTRTVQIELDHESYRHNYLYRLRFIRSLPKGTADVLMYPTYSRSSVGDEIARLVKAKSKIAFSGDDLCMAETLRRRNLAIYSSTVECSPWLEEGEKYHLLLRALGRNERLGDEIAVDLSAIGSQKAGEVEKIDAMLRNRPFVVFFPAASNPLKQWSIVQAAECVDQISLQHQREVVLCGAKLDDQYLRQIATRATRIPLVVSNLFVPEIASLLTRADCVLSVDTGPAHLAAALRIPTVVLLGGGQYGRHFVKKQDSVRALSHQLDCFNCNWHCPFPEPYCMTRIPVPLVLEAVASSFTSSKRVVA